MSKTSQRRQSFYNLGFNDAMKNLKQRFSRSFRFSWQYRMGYHHGKKQNQEIV
jgi:hypothetical protein